MAVAGGKALDTFEFMKTMETFFESYLQLIFTLYVILKVGVDNAMFLDIVNIQIFSIAISALSVIYGLSNNLLKTLEIEMDDKKLIEKIYSSMLASMVVFIDIALRAVVYVTMFLIFNAFAVIVPSTIFILSTIVFKYKLDENFADAMLVGALSVVSSHVLVKVTWLLNRTEIRRFISICVCLISIAAMTIALNVDVSGNQLFDHFNHGIFNTTTSRNICNVTSESVEVLYTTTDTLWTMTLVAWVLLVLSCIEGLLELCRCPFMPLVILFKMENQREKPSGPEEIPLQ